MTVAVIIGFCRISPLTDADSLLQPATRPTVRRALLLSSISRFVAAFISLIATFVIARILSPADFGLHVLGAALFPIAEALRDLGLVPFLVQHKALTRRKVQTVFTFSLAATLAIAALMFALAAPLADFFNAPILLDYVRVLSLAFLLGPVFHPIYGLMSRDLAFGRIALIDMISTLVNTAASVLLVRAGWNITGIAWALVLSNGVSALLFVAMKPELWIYRPSLRHTREILAFGLNGGAASLIARSGEAASYFLLGTLLGPHATGVLQRAALIAFWPERIILSGLMAIALPAFSSLAHQGKPLGPSYVHALSIASAINWTALATVAILAKPVVAVLLGPAWQEVVPLVHIFVLAAVFTFPIGLNAAVQAAAGGIAQAPFVTFFQYGLGLAVVIIGTRFGMTGVAWCTLAATPFMAAIGTVYLRRVVDFEWGQLIGALLQSAMLTGCSALFAVTTVVLLPAASPAFQCIAGGFASGLGFLIAILIIPHPLRDELRGIGKSVSRRV